MRKDFVFDFSDLSPADCEELAALDRQNANDVLTVGSISNFIEVNKYRRVAILLTPGKW